MSYHGDGFHRGNGYRGYSMSNNAVDAYNDGEMPLSKWTKRELLDAIEAENNKINVSKLTSEELRDNFLTYAGYHHTSSYYNSTVFYRLKDSVEDLTQSDIDQIIANRKKREKKEPKPYESKKQMSALVRFTEWTGTRSHPRPVEHTEAVHYIENDKTVDTSVGKKRMTSLNIIYEAEGLLDEAALRRKRQQEFEDKRREEKQALLDKAESPESRQWIEKHYPSIQTSSSGSVYALGRKPSQYDYANGVQNFFKEGEERLSPNGEGKLVLQSWNGSEWKNRALSNDTLQSDEAQVRSVMSVCAKKIAAEIGRGIGKSESIRSSVPFARGGRPKGNAPRGK